MINITIPVYNEANILFSTVDRLYSYLHEHISFPYEIVIANNGSTDRTLQVARTLARKYSNLQILDVAGKGRGRALKQAWARSSADILTYMDCDLSTDLQYFQPLVDPLISKAYDIAIGSRLLPESSAVRGLKRSVISKTYNRLVQALFHVQFTDAQCGFKAIQKRVFADVLPFLKNDNWFMDTELLILAEKRGFRILDLPVNWIDDPDSKVRIISTVMEHIQGLIRLKRNMAAKGLSRQTPPRN